MEPGRPDPLTIRRTFRLQRATLVLAFSGWMDGGDVSTGTVSRLIHLLGAEQFAEIDAEPFFIFNFPGSMEIAALFRPHTTMEGGLIKDYQTPSSAFFVHQPANLVLFVGKEPNLNWRAFGDCIFRVAHQVGVERIIFVGSFGGSVPHTREPRLFVMASDAALVEEMKPYGLRPSDYQGPASFNTYLITRAEEEGLEMISLAAEIPSYLQGTNPLSIEAVTRRLAKILKLPLDLASLRAASTEWELKVSSIIEQNEELAETVRQLEEAYDNQLLDQETEDVV